MLYLIHPRSSMKASTWIDLGSSNYDEDRLSTLPWRSTDEIVDPTLIQLALRQGIPCASGIVFHHELVVLRNGVKRWQTPEPQPPNSDRVMPTDLGEDYLEAVRRFDEQVERDRLAMLALAQHRLDAAMAQPIRKSLLSHWGELTHRTYAMSN